jgi:hypothetical protein
VVTITATVPSGDGRYEAVHISPIEDGDAVLAAKGPGRQRTTLTVHVRP